MVKKGVSAEEKRTRMLEILRESQTCWLLKDLEKAGAKKGVISQSVKDVIQSLVDDDLVNTDKVGQSNWFWAFPSEAGQKSRKRLEMLETELDAVKKRRVDLESKKQTAEGQRTDSDDRSAKMATLAKLEAEQKALKAEFEQFKENDPQYFQNLKEYVGVAHESANRWTDNIFQLQKWCNDKFQGESEKVKQGFKSLGVDLDTLDYID
mmetsp:Transcript_1453/g.2921  ORF Transcript_1453/g.2921 Transcript_1453/m.2921 type:complete len:208 (-) Transcript_1453:188-811(-)|eukprot:CAMPEP_0118933238 /NCGR_PEP_ID=MMETSP1169-20130426/11754_1 /TAXON_ID=36882 /ORGANISM="Pyramimonas obovata, Strain CCMP722" /LENGTH=207 /DNA_ID=CAMNT_0006875977 /DNA_START=290 /DNA_END=913 /DNA_ORIENTATION=+